MAATPPQEDRPTMYLCVCKGLTDRAVTQAADQGAATVAQVFKRCGQKPQCGRCFNAIREALESHPRRPLVYDPALAVAAE